MDRDPIGWKRYWVVAPTPFTVQGTLDENALRSVLHLYNKQGAHGVLINGTTGEWFSQTETERRRVAEVAVEEHGAKIPVVILDEAVAEEA
jgi:1-pyrroline-4-hydroxy-2-carboxylate deaminase